MANPNVTVRRARERKWACTHEHVFKMRVDAEAWLATLSGDRKTVRSVKVGRREDRLVAYVARVYELPKKEAR